MYSIGVTGATGFLGSALCRSFAQRGWPVVRFSRRGAQGAEGEVRPFDLMGDVEPDLRGVDILIHAAHDVHSRPGAEGANVDGARKIFAAAATARVRRIALISSMAASGDSASVYGREKHRIEALLDPSRDLVVRPGLIIGNGGLFKSMYEATTRYRIAPLFSGGAQPVYVVGLEDLCESIASLIENEAHGVRIIANPEPVTMSALYRAIAQKAGTPLLALPLPLEPVLGIVSTLERLGVRLAIDSERLNGLKNLRMQAVSDTARRPLLPLESLMESLRIS